MAKNKILSWMNFQGLKEIAGIALYSFRKTSMDAWKAFMENRGAILEKPKEVQSKATKVGLEAIRNMQLQKLETLKKAEKPKKSDETYGGIFTDAPDRKPSSKQ